MLRFTGGINEVNGLEAIMETGGYSGGAKRGKINNCLEIS
jgi:hypothetical protein